VTQSWGRTISSLQILAAILAIGIILVSTGRGPGVGGDATVYINSASSLDHGLGLGMPGPDGNFQPLSYYPPLFPLSLSALGILGVNLVSGARWLNALLFGLLVWLTGFTLAKSSRSPLAGLLTAVILAVSPIAIPPFSWAMSEPLANFLGFLGLALLLEYFENSARRAWLYLSALACGLSIITRYASLPFLAAGALGLLAMGRGRFSRLFAQAAAYLGVGLVPPVVWEVWDYTHSSSLASRALEKGGAGLISNLSSFWQSLRLVFLGWFFPDSWLNSFLHNGLLQSLLAIVGLAVLAGWTVLLLRCRISQSEPGSFRLVGLIVIFGVIYTVFILLTYLVIYPTIDVSQRIMLPLHVALIWLLGGLALLSLRTAPRLPRNAVIVAVVGALLLTGWYASRSVRIVQQNFSEGLGYFSTSWQASPTIRQVSQLPQNTLIVSNEPTAILFLTGRQAYSLAEPRQAQPVPDFYRYGDGPLAADPAQQVFRRKGAALVLFSNIFDDMAGLYGDRTQARVQSLVQGLRISFSGSDGWIYFYPESTQ
jgi:4-amino-4-deoxy-L-arabinose transferase-like glycosyltransferase